MLRIHPPAIVMIFVLSIRNLPNTECIYIAVLLIRKRNRLDVKKQQQEAKLVLTVSDAWKRVPGGAFQHSLSHLPSGLTSSRGFFGHSVGDKCRALRRQCGSALYRGLLKMI
ncbi:hypothetical protein CEXT_709361 [Caerostris extrusa]|uniref:Secreted protein n=1 Tax=Caerostris extrusa TaxID=172846 RepID=A0AAV4NM27_CAEEX|nr:hypothetical protein CEXT_709361 [Caerostris extrusa]